MGVENPFDNIVNQPPSLDPEKLKDDEVEKNEEVETMEDGSDDEIIELTDQVEDESRLYKDAEVLPYEAETIYKREGSEVPLSDEYFEENARVREKIGEQHGRSYQERFISGGAVWGERFGDKVILQSALSEKGVPVKGVDIKIEKDAAGLRTHGLVDQVYSDTEEMINISNTLSEAGLPTEVILEVKRLSTIKVDGKSYYFNEFKDLLKEKAIKEGLNEEEVGTYLENVDFSTIERSMPVGERVKDLENLNEFEFKEMFKRVFDFVNIRLKMEAEGKTPGIGDFEKFKDGFNVKDDGSIREYLVEYLPERMGEYLAKMHETGLSHGSASSQNWLLSGDLCDLDSVGRALDDRTIFDDLVASMGSLLKKGEGDSFYNKLLEDEDFSRRRIDFLKTYLKERNLPKEFAEEFLEYVRLRE